MTRSFNIFGARVGAMAFAITLCWGATACTDDGETTTGEEMETTGDTMMETSGETTGGELSYAADIQPIWEASCVVGCHTPGGIFEGLDLGGDSYGNVVGVASTQAPGLSLVEASASDMSYIVNKLRNTQAGAGGNGSQMPTGGAPLPEDTIATIEAWIDAGAMP